MNLWVNWLKLFHLSMLSMKCWKRAWNQPHPKAISPTIFGIVVKELGSPLSLSVVKRTIAEKNPSKNQKISKIISALKNELFENLFKMYSLSKFLIKLFSSQILSMWYMYWFVYVMRFIYFMYCVIWSSVHLVI